MTRPTSADVARLAHVSPSTVSFVLNDVKDQKISERTRAAVIAAAEQLGYRPNLAARALASGVSGVVVFVVPDAHFGELSLQLMSELESALADEGMTLAVHFQGARRRSLMDVVTDLSARAVVAFGDLDAATAQALRARNVPVIASLGREATWEGTGSATSDLQVQRLRNAGHTSLAFADTTDPGLAELSEARYRAADRAYRGEEPMPRAMFPMDPSSAGRIVKIWRRSGITGICAFNDEIALSVLAGIHECSLRCPEDMAVIGVDNLTVGTVSMPPLTTIAFDLTELAADYAIRVVHVLTNRDPSPESMAPTLWIIDRGSI